MAATDPWWRGAVLYHVYVRSFFDSNGDGQGDLAGVLAKLDYISGLGVDGIWLSPIHPSPDRDWGYDVADYEGVHPDYGTLDDFKALLDAAHALGLKVLLDAAHAHGLRVLLDEVLAHTSDEHPWFAESRDGGRTGPKADWYVWADPRDDGTAPNNWLSVFGGPAWAYQPARRQHYHHKFLRQQPKLNWRNPQAKAAALAVLDHWLALGVDGFRLDVANALLHDADLTDNPPVPQAERTAYDWSHAGNLQRHLFDSNLPQNIPLLDEIRRRVEAHGDRFVFGEFSEEEERCGAYCGPDQGLHSGYTFVMLLARDLSPGFVRSHAATLARFPGHWPMISFSNHDTPRTVSRFGGETPHPDLARMMFVLLLTLRGSALIYQGEELGLPEARLTRRQLRDPVGDLYWPTSKGRDGARTPMPWRADAPNLGFTTGVPWLPACPDHAGLTVEAQAAHPTSMLAFARAVIALRKASPALSRGEIEMLEAPEPVLAFLRRLEDETAICIFNMSAATVRFTDERLLGAAKLMTQGAVLEEGALILSPYGVGVFQAARTVHA